MGFFPVARYDLYACAFKNVIHKDCKACMILWNLKFWGGGGGLGWFESEYCPKIFFLVSKIMLFFLCIVCVCVVVVEERVLAVIVVYLLTVE